MSEFSTFVKLSAALLFFEFAFSVPLDAQYPTCLEAIQFQKRAELAESRLNDWPMLNYYKLENGKVKPATAGEQRVVFMGDSILGLWFFPQDFPGRPYLNRAIGGQDTSQMLLRFRTDVVALAPKVVIIMGGINDLRHSQSAETIHYVEGNLASMAEIARSNGIRVVFGSITPITETSNKTALQETPLQKAILAVNMWLKDYTNRSGQQYMDVYAELVDDKKGFRADLTVDGLHPSRKGYQIMAPIVTKAIQAALSSP